MKITITGMKIFWGFIDHRKPMSKIVFLVFLPSQYGNFFCNHPNGKIINGTKIKVSIKVLLKDCKQQKQLYEPQFLQF